MANRSVFLSHFCRKTHFGIRGGRFPKLHHKNQLREDSAAYQNLRASLADDLVQRDTELSQARFHSDSALAPEEPHGLKNSRTLSNRGPRDHLTL